MILKVASVSKLPRCILMSCVSLSLSHTHRAVLQPLSGTTRVSRYQKRHSPTHTRNVLWESVIILDFMRCGEDNRGKCANNPAGRHPIWTNNAPTSIIPPILHRMPFLPQPFQFMLDCISGTGWLAVGQGFTNTSQVSNYTLRASNIKSHQV